MTDEVVLDVWLNDYPVVPLFLSETRKLAEAFGRTHPGIRVEVRGIDHVRLPQEVARAAAEGRQPAIVQSFYTSTQLAADLLTADGAPLFTSIEKAIAGRDEILGVPVRLDDLVTAARDYYTLDDDGLFALPPLTSTTLLYANTTLLEAAGVTEVPRTWEGITAACEAVAALDDGPAHGITWPNHGWMFQQAVAQQGGLLALPGNGRAGRATGVALDSPALLAFVDWWRRLHAQGHYHYTGLRSAGDDTYPAWELNYRAFAGQQVAFVLSTSVEADRMVQAGREGGFRVEVAPMPHSAAVPYAGNVIGGDSLWLAAGLDPDTRDAALAFLLSFLTPQNAAERHRTSGFIPVTESARALLEEDGWFARNAHHQVALDQLAQGDRSPASRGAVLGDFVSVQDCMTAAMHDVLTSAADPAVRFARATAEAQELLDDYNAHCLGLVPGPRGPHRFRVG
ncbi:extracellular solute-binding protein [Streptomyces antarcticus]|uniref:extracellular solute-binding protein n=1 Tax=Streptomyces antarcticus TaxID=2996458 RepID=UPI00226F8FBF|nr:MULTISPECIES: extracellular solute-binding protein [unclassified Streptomyces]MCY0942933.1 extracellular solute-binding protein [Streptomyces sp. H34-AA3]MCY0953020.1 extracellular solute-binding protein [Streptomyces sp. H27-S2]MCZ4083107.1 extracellular solute-binding protein [Streptomyces sp. H34-S5]